MNTTRVEAAMADYKRIARDTIVIIRDAMNISDIQLAYTNLATMDKLFTEEIAKQTFSPAFYKDYHTGIYKLAKDRFEDLLEFATRPIEQNDNNTST